MARRTDDLGIDEKLLDEFEKLSDEEVKTKLRKRITAKHSRAPKPDVKRALKILKDGYRTVNEGQDDESHIPVPIDDIVTYMLKCLKMGATAENIPAEIAKGWVDKPPFDWADQETRTWVYFRAKRVGVDPVEALAALDPNLARKPFHGPVQRSGAYYSSVTERSNNPPRVARRRR